jgi:hypothetical protein
MHGCRVVVSLLAALLVPFTTYAQSKKVRVAVLEMGRSPPRQPRPSCCRRSRSPKPRPSRAST